MTEFEKKIGILTRIRETWKRHPELCLSLVYYYLAAATILFSCYLVFKASSTNPGPGVKSR